jgi:hypothetical protein
MGRESVIDMAQTNGKNALAMVSRLPQLLAVFVLFGVAATSRAAEGDATTAILGIEAVDGQDNGVANDITEALRQRLASTKGVRLVPGKDLVEIKLVFSCSDDAPACLAQAANTLGATKLIYGNLKRSAGDYVLSLKLLDAARGVVEGSTVETIGKRKSDPMVLRVLSPQWLARLRGKAGASGAAVASGGAAAGDASLIIRSNVPGATVTLDGNEVGITTRKALTVEDVTPGRHELKAEKAGYAPTTQQFTIAGAQALPLNLTMRADGEKDDREPEATTTRRAPSGDEPPPSPSDDGRTWARTGFWIALGLGVVSFGVATKYGLDVRKVNSDLDQYRGKTDLSTAQAGTVRTKLSDGNQAETRQWIFVGVGSAFTLAAAGVGGFLLYRGYLDKESGTGPSTSDNHGLRVFPTANTSSGGIAAEFDF